MSRADPIRDNYFSAAEKADSASDLLFYMAAALSFAALFLDQQCYPKAYAWVQVLFASASLGLFAIGLASRLYFMPRAENKRRQEFFGHAFQVNLTHEKTDGYYNNELTNPIERIAAQVLENSHFTKNITLRMAHRERLKISIYAVVWVVCLLNRQTEIGIIVTASQVVFSEQLISKLLRLEWLRSSSENTFEEMYRIFQSKPDPTMFNAMVLHSLGVYEAAKVNAAVMLDSKLFDKLNTKLSAEWDVIKAKLGILAVTP